MKRRAEAGFSLIEILIVTVVIGVLAAIVLVNLLNALEKSKQRATMGDMRTVSKAVETYQIDVGHYPTGGVTVEQLLPVLVPFATSTLPRRDHWQHDYRFASNAADLYTIESYGKDGVDGPNITPATRWEFDRDILLSNGIFTAAPEQ